MTAQMISAVDVIRDARLDLESARVSLSQVESLIFAATKLQEHPAHLSNLLHAAWALAADGAKGALRDFESISDALGVLAPRSEQFENVAQESEVHP